MQLKSSELIINPDGSIYHLLLKPGEIANDIITVGDSDRVERVAKHLDTIELTRQNREFKTITGTKNGKRLTIISTGIGTDNIDIVFNELDALVNVDFTSREIKPELTQLNFYRIGTSGTLREEIPIDSHLISVAAIDMGNLSEYYHYESDGLAKTIENDISYIDQRFGNKSVIIAAQTLVERLSKRNTYLKGITFTAPGFYAPQRRSLRLKTKMPDFSVLNDLSWNGINITNLEMETAGIYLLASLLGHQAISCNALLANRMTGEFSSRAQMTIDELIEKVIGDIVRD